MRILHTADWHLGKKLENFNRIEEQKEVLQEIVAIAERERVELVLIAGDLFDNFNPSAEANELLYKTLRRLSSDGKRAVVAIAGNHDSADRIEAPDPLARACGIFFSGYPNTDIGEFRTDNGIVIQKSTPGFIELTIPSQSYPIRLLLTPYANEFRIRTYLGEDSEEGINHYLQNKWKELADVYCDSQGVNILMAHLYMMEQSGIPPEESEDERAIMIGNATAIFTENIPPAIQYAALGHIHKPQQLSPNNNVFYSGSPIAYSFSEASQQKVVNIIDIEPNSKPIITTIPIVGGKKLFREHFATIDDAVNWLQNHQDALVELTIDCKEYLSATDRKTLMNAHNGIVSIIPNILNQAESDSATKSLDLTQSMETLFLQYFLYKKGTTPNKDIIDLFKEALSK